MDGVEGAEQVALEEVVRAEVGRAMRGGREGSSNQQLVATASRKLVRLTFTSSSISRQDGPEGLGRS